MAWPGHAALLVDATGIYGIIVQMTRHPRLAPLSTVVLAVYVLSVALVCSFILFEVLDIDGSDFPAAPVQGVTPPHPAEASHDLKRTHLAGMGPIWSDVHPPDTAGLNLSLRVQRSAGLAAMVPSSPAALAHRITLARSSLDGSAASA